MLQKKLPNKSHTNNNKKTMHDPDETEKTIDYESLLNIGMFFLHNFFKQSLTNRVIKV